MASPAPVFTAEHRRRVEDLLGVTSLGYGDVTIRDHEAIRAALAEIDRLQAERVALLAACRSADGALTAWAAECRRLGFPGRAGLYLNLATELRAAIGGVAPAAPASPPGEGVDDACDD